MKQFYMTVMYMQNEKYWATVNAFSESCNLKSILNDERIIAANMMPTKKQAEEVLKVWNDGFKAKGVYAL